MKFSSFFSSFKGGIHPPHHKKLTQNKEFINLSIPGICRIPLVQHIGKPAIPVVEKGDVVKVGQLIAKSDGFISSNIHSPIPGPVLAIEDYPTPLSPKGKCIVIEASGNFNAPESPDNDWKDKSSEELIEIVSNSGIVGLGGAAFPSNVKLAPPKNKKITTLIINGAECEPYLTVDDTLMRTFPRQILEGIKITLKMLNLKNAIIGIEDNKPEAFKLFKSEIEKIQETDCNISIKKLPAKYPQGSEKQLINVLLKEQVPSGGLPMDAGAVVHNVGTLYAIYEAVVKEKPLYERYITVSGSLIKKPGNYKVKLGTLISDIVEDCGGLKEEPAKIVLGGPMCGLSVNSMDLPVIKGTSGILFLSAKEVSLHQSERYYDCIRCGRCVSACPIRLNPSALSISIEKADWEKTKGQLPLDCIMCGACSYICPSRRPISHFIKMAQEKIRSKKI